MPTLDLIRARIKRAHALEKALKAALTLVRFERGRWEKTLRLATGQIPLTVKGDRNGHA